MEGLDRIIREHPFFAGLDAEFCTLVVGCAKNVRFEAGQYLFREGQPADQFYLLRHGRVALEVDAPGRGPITFQTLDPGDIVGVSWLFPPYRWSYDAKALELVGAVALDGACLRPKLEANHSLGYDVMKRIVPILAERMQDARLQMLDVYGS